MEQDLIRGVLEWVAGGVVTFGGWMIRRLVNRVDDLEKKTEWMATYEDIEKYQNKSSAEMSTLRRDITELGTNLRQEIRDQVSFVVDVIRNK